MADIIITAGSNGFRAMRSVVFISPSVGYLIYMDSLQDLAFIKTTDGGATWTGSTVIFTGNVLHSSAWYDRWTPGDNGTTIHCWWIEDVGHDVLYRALNTSNDSLGTQVTVFNGATATGSYAAHVSGAKMRGGNLLVSFSIDAGVETGLYRSTDSGATWGARTNTYEVNADTTLVFPGNEADNQDGWILYQDSSANEVTLKTHDDSANTNSESAVILTLVENAADANRYPWGGAIRRSDGHLIAAFWTEVDSVTGDFRVFDINGAGSLVEKTAIATNIDDCYYPAVHVASNGAIYVVYNGKKDGTETLLITTGIYYVKSTDGGATWSAEQPYSAAVSDWRQVWAPLNGPRFLAAWWDISAGDVIVNFDNSVVTQRTTIVGGGIGGFGAVLS